jgi:phospholipid/cholesterol/gamma-HCH transport system substrate-binding protein
MTISNETKVGALTAIAIVLLILGFNFLKGTPMFNTHDTYYAVFDDIQGLANSNPVVINGKQVGTVAKTDGGADMRRILVHLHMIEDVNIPTDATAVISKSLLGNVQVEIKLGQSKAYLKNKDTVKTIDSPDLFGDALKKIDPVLYTVTSAVRALDSLLKNVNTILDPATKEHVRVMMANLDKTTANLAISSAALQKMLEVNQGAINGTMKNVESITTNFKNNNEKINQSLAHVEKATGQLAQLNLASTMQELNATLANFKDLLGKASAKDGSLGLLMNDTRLYNNLNATTNKLNLLLDDFRLHPKRYVNVSVFGKKDKTKPLQTPLPDTVNAPYLQQQ